MNRNRTTYAAGNALPFVLPSEEEPSTSFSKEVYYLNPQVSNRSLFPFLISHMDSILTQDSEFLRGITLRDLFVDWGDAYWLTNKSEGRIQWFCWIANQFILKPIGDIPISALEEKSLQKLISDFAKEARRLRTDPYYIHNVLYSLLSFAVRLGATDNPYIIRFLDRYLTRNSR